MEPYLPTYVAYNTRVFVLVTTQQVLGKKCLITTFKVTFKISGFLFQFFLLVRIMRMHMIAQTFFRFELALAQFTFKIFNVLFIRIQGLEENKNKRLVSFGK